MAVEARHNMSLFPAHQFLLTNRDYVKMNQETMNNAANYYVQSSVINNQETQYPGLIAQQHSTAIPQRKRQREYQSNEMNNAYHPLMDNNIALQILQHQSEIDLFVAQHAEKVRFEVENQRKREARMVVSLIEEGIAKKLREKDEEIARMGKMNWALQERVKTLCVENQIWKDLAQSNEATATALRTNLEELLLSHVSRGGAGEQNDAVEDDAESFCGENDAVEADERRCRECEAGEARVLVLPCRHLCLCTACGSTVRACPVCHSVMTASVRVNFS